VAEGSDYAATRVGSVSAEAGGVPGEVEEVQDCCNFSEDVEGVYHPASVVGAAAVLLGDTAAAAAAAHHVHG
jgi:hypothetical protein